MPTGPKQNTPLYETARQLCDFLPGIDRLIYIGGNGNYSEWTAFEWIKSGNGYKKNRLEITGEINSKLVEIRKQKPGRMWTDQRSVPFYVAHGKHTISPQLTLEHEQDHLTLVVRLDAPGTLNDIIYIFFRNDKSNFGISHDSTPIDTSQKSIIGMLTYNFANIIYQKTRENNSFVNDIKREFVELLRFHTQGGSENDEKGRFDKWKHDWAVSTLSELSERDGLNYVYQEEALEMLINNGHSFGVVKKALEDAVRIASLLAVSPEDDIFIEKYFIKFTKVNNELGSESDSDDDGLPTRLDKVYQFLDRLEDASRKLIERDVKPTSELVGKEMDEQITAPAIRDFLKKNRSRVVMLLKKNPERWRYIRKNFRPVLNVLPKNNHLLNSNAG